MSCNLNLELQFNSDTNHPELGQNPQVKRHFTAGFPLIRCHAHFWLTAYKFGGYHYPFRLNISQDSHHSGKHHTHSYPIIDNTQIVKWRDIIRSGRISESFHASASVEARLDMFLEPTLFTNKEVPLTFNVQSWNFIYNEWLNLWPHDWTQPTIPLPRAGLAQSPYPVITWSGLPRWPVHPHMKLSRGPPLVISILIAIVQRFKQLVNNNISITWEIPRVSVALYQEPRTKKQANSLLHNREWFCLFFTSCHMVAAFFPLSKSLPFQFLKNSSKDSVVKAAVAMYQK